MKDLILRPATSDDIDIFVTQYDTTLARHKTNLPHKFGQTVGGERYRELITQLCATMSDSGLIVAEHAGHVVGYVVVMWRYSSVRAGHEASITDIWVDPEHRRQGIGSRLVEAATEFANKQRASSIASAVWMAQPAAIGLFEASSSNEACRMYERVLDTPIADVPASPKKSRWKRAENILFFAAIGLVATLIALSR